MTTDKEKQLFAERLAKLEKLQASGLAVYPAKSHRTHTVSEALSDFSSLEKGSKGITLAGRIRALRGHGGLVFGDLEDASGKLQFAVKADAAGQELMRDFKHYDVGDFVEMTGTVFITRQGEKTLEASDFRMLSKSLRALPEKFHGLKDTETRLRRRYLDMLSNPEARELFRKKSVFWSSVRNFLVEHGFLEVQTPVLEVVPGGADATPFVTHHNALDRDFYLRISLELPLKRLLVGGFERVFEIGRLFRNEGIDREHLQEYDDMEFYWAYADDKDGMRLVEALFKSIVKAVTGQESSKFEKHELVWNKPWPTMDYFDVFKERTGLDLDTIDAEALNKYAKKKNIPFEKNYGLGRMIDTIYKREVRPHLIQPTFLSGHPLAISPLSKLDPENPKKVLRFQVLAAGTELGNGWAELNDPIDQRKRFTEQMKLRAAGDKEAQMLDEDFVEALEYGMPPAVGFGMSERVFAVLMNKSIRETVIFPLMKEESGIVEGKSKTTSIAVAIINRTAGLERWQEMNTVAHLNAAFGARTGRKLFYQDAITTSDDQSIKLNIQHAIMLKSANSVEDLAELAGKAKAQNLEVAEFTREMLETTNDQKVISNTLNKKFSEVEYLGILIFGEKKQVEELTRSFALYS